MQPMYLKRAHKRFLSGTHFKTPAEAVESGQRSLQDWSRVLLEERERDLQLLLSKRSNRGVAQAGQNPGVL